jgi:hypothetical protein
MEDLRRRIMVRSHPGTQEFQRCVHPPVRGHTRLRRNSPQGCAIDRRHPTTMFVVRCATGVT